MQARELTPDSLRRLADLRVDSGAVLSVYVNLDPSQFPTTKDRRSVIGSVMDEADRSAREVDGRLSHEDRMALKEDVARVRGYLEDADLAGARAMAVFAARPADLFESIRLPRAVANEVEVARSPLVEPLADLLAGGTWLVLLANRREGRFFRGSAERLQEVGRIQADTPGRHDQGGWSQARYGRHIEELAERHLKRCVEALMRRWRRSRFDHLLIGAPDDSHATIIEKLPSELAARLRDRVSIDVENPNADQVLEAARPLIEKHERAQQDQLIDRLREGLGANGRAAAALDEVLDALNQRRVEALLLDHGFGAPGVECPQCGWIGSAGRERCPADETPLERHESVTDAAVERAVSQDAEVAVLRDRPDLGPHGGIAALLRF